MNLPSFFLLLDILDIAQCTIPYILFKLEKTEKNEAISYIQYANKLFGIYVRSFFLNYIYKFITL